MHILISSWYRYRAVYLQNNKIYLDAETSRGRYLEQCTYKIGKYTFADAYMYFLVVQIYSSVLTKEQKKVWENTK